ncbi:capping protein inhibiting regulator of actin dynamics isoform X1 [Mesocricetus auratus]|uniref:Capping protein inhibiting regulator of actin dynamics isoform X1 n=3 Tax=Mesocricetus auratus TaxID=10036 RepID=A0ABM2XKF0_MESAU|nr:capping protein inhibiting regulator of actin dynamics isoform X1 [Mesocricetus auratus]XP_040603181.1 capping protein inhibiting regulator of actin dynamics isoform X1 [Mesocricetus auratus]
MGARAFSHDSIFIPDGGAENEQTVQAMSQDNILGKVKTLQRQLGKNIKFGQRPSNAIPMKKAGSADASSDEDFFLTSPMEIVTQQDIVLSDTENKPSDTPSSSSPLNLPEAGSEMEEKVAPVKPSRPKRHLPSTGTIESVNLDAIPLAIARLDNSAAKHKLSVKPKNQRVSRKHRWLAQDRQNVPGSFESQSSVDQNGQPGEDRHIWHEEEPEPLESREDKRLQEEYWRELEAKCKRQKAEAAEKRRLEEQRRQALERRLWEENLRQELLEEEEGEEEDLQLEAAKAPPGQASGLEEQGCAEQVLGKADHPEAEGRQHGQEEAERQQEKLRQEEAERQAEKLRQEEAERQQEKLRQEEELRQSEKLRQEEAQRQEEELRKLEAQKQEEKLRQLEAERQEEELRKLEAQKQEEKLRQLEAERQEEELRKLEAQRQEEKLRQLEAERQEEELRKLEAQKQEEKLRQLEAERQEEELRKLEAQKQEEKLRQLEAERQHAQEEEEEAAEHTEELNGRATLAPQVDEGPQGPEGEGQAPLADDAHQQSPLQQDLEKPEEQGNLDSAGQGEMAQEQEEAAKAASEPAGQRGDSSMECGGVDAEEREATQVDIPLPQEEQMGAPPASEDKNEAVAADNDRKVEELRWQEVDERQTMPRPYTFQVSSGGRQILFPKVNLSPVTPAKDASPAPLAQDPPAPRGAAAHGLPSALSIPHTAILVTGAQLCGPAVNLSQIKDSACKSLLGLSEEKRPPVDVPAAEGRSGGSKARPPPESPSNAAALAEWASIRSRILKNAEGDQRGDREPARAGDEPAPRARCDSRGNVRRTPPANAKFSIMPAWQKFADGGAEIFRQSLDGEGVRKRLGSAVGEETAPQPPPAATPEPRKSLEKQEVSQEPPDTTDGCKFAKDLPSFLVPGLPSPQKAASRTGSTTTSDSETTSDIDPVVPGGEEKASPFGIKLRRTNYSLRFHCDQQAEQKKKKRHSSVGDAVDGGTPAAGGDPGEREPEAVALKHGASLPQEKKPALAPRRDSAESSASGHSITAAQSGLPPADSQAPVPEQNKAASKTPPMQKPALAPKPTSQTPPSSPLSKLSRPHLVELLARRVGKVDSEPSKESSDNQPPSPSLPEEPKGPKRDEEAVPEKKLASPPLSASQQERPSLTSETGRKEKPMLQSRHSLDGSKLTEKVETAQPLWITLALQKQKGFREQQATREERKQAREAKQAEKLSKEAASVSPQPGNSRGSRAGSLHKSATPSEEKKPETAVSRLQRREQLKKANTLPTSVTVEISDSAPPAPLVKEAPKRFSTPDAAPVSTEPAWLALAKRKAKAWSDCPQIIK